MKPAAFAYHAPDSVQQALDTLADTAPGAKVLAGGQSLIPLLNMRLAEPAHLVDINRVAELDTIEADSGGARIGALARHARVERDAAVGAVQPLLHQALQLVAHPVIRNRGTVVGSLVHADPAAELPAVLALLGGSVRLASRGGQRDVPAADFFVGPLESAARQDELAVSAYFPAVPVTEGGHPPGLHWGCAMAEVARRHGDYALVGVAAMAALDDDLRIARARIGLLSVGPVPEVLDLTEACAARPPAACDWPAVAGRVRDAVRPDADLHASAEYRTQLAGVLAVRALRAACARAVDGE